MYFTYRVIAAVLGLGLILVQSLITGKAWHEPPIWVPILLACSVGMIAMVDNIRGAWAARKGNNHAERRARIEKVVSVALAAIAHDSKHNMALLGVSVFAVRHRFVRNGLKVNRVETLKRIVRFRMSDIPQPSKIAWVPSKGCIGEAWSTRRSSYIDWRPIADRHGGDQLVSEERYSRLSAKARAGFTYDEFRGIVDKYAEILAVPILSDPDGTVLGVVSFDRPRIDDEDPNPILDSPKARGSAELAAAALRGDV